MCVCAYIYIYIYKSSFFRRALKAAFILVPLFGIHLILIIYRPQQPSSAAFIYELFTYIASNGQVNNSIWLYYCGSSILYIGAMMSRLSCQ